MRVKFTKIFIASLSVYWYNRFQDGLFKKRVFHWQINYKSVQCNLSDEWYGYFRIRFSSASKKLQDAIFALMVLYKYKELVDKGGTRIEETWDHHKGMWSWCNSENAVYYMVSDKYSFGLFPMVLRRGKTTNNNKYWYRECIKTHSRNITNPMYFEM